jgi:hypothetical protein
MVVMIVTSPTVATRELVREGVDDGFHEIDGGIESDIRHTVVEDAATVGHTEADVERLAVDGDLVGRLDSRPPAGARACR